MAFKLEQKRAWTTVHVSEPGDDGRVAEHSFRAQFSPVTREEMLALMDVKDSAGLPRNIGKLLLDHLHDWDEVVDAAGRAVPFTPERAAALVELPFVAVGLADALFTAFRIGRPATKRPKARARMH